MQLFDILIGNQDRHPFNWQLLFLETGAKFSPIYDNGASLGFRFEDEKLIQMVSNPQEMNKYTEKTRVKAGIFEKKKVKAKDLLTYIRDLVPVHCDPKSRQYKFSSREGIRVVKLWFLSFSRLFPSVSEPRETVKEST
ncbi:hypothetical protein [Anoxybacillus flavithermus]|uniref:hypothetical protein n=1 Tax=Anoxybacillus flavithermus TaxID=33934 RepID=UPI001F511BD4|nr:hypothetical protein [Anoxybacillus flavithermus]